jgi:hypothetical protein
MISERRIGREMAIALRQLQVSSGSGAWPTLTKRHVLRCDTGRSALRLALLDWQGSHPLKPAVWIPSYACPSVSAAVAATGLDIRVFEDRPGLSSWLMPPSPAAQDIVLVIHYFGVINRAACSWADGQPHRTWGLLEDCVQSPYSVGAGLRGDYAIASLRKWWPAPDGAVVCSGHAVAGSNLAPPNERYVTQRLAARLVSASRECDALYLRWVEESEQVLADAQPRESSWISSQLLESADSESASTVRRNNWSVLLEGLGSEPGVQPLFDALAIGEVPLGFPILVANGARDRLRAFLKERQVFCPVHWKLSSGFTRDREMSDQILTIPLDQRYEKTDMESVLGHIRKFLAS